MPGTEDTTPRGATIYSVAAAAGVSIATVSRVVAGSTVVSETTRTKVLAAMDALDYLPSERWLRQMEGKTAADDLRVGRGIAAITGSTLSSHAVTGGVRRALAIYAVLFGEP